MTTIQLLGRAAAVIGAIAFGVFLGRLQRTTPKLVESTAPTVHAQAVELATLRSENERLKTQLHASQQMTANAAGAREAATLANTPALDQLRFLATLKKRKLASSTMAYVDAQGNLTPGFTELFALTPAEQRTLQQSIDVARDRLADLERANATIERDAGGAIRISVKPFPEAGGVAYDELLKSFSDTLGPDRHAAFLALGVEQVERALARFGAAQRTITISEEIEPDGSLQYRVLDAHRLPQESGNNSAQYGNFQEATRHLGTLARLLPTDFRAAR